MEESTKCGLTRFKAGKSNLLTIESYYCSNIFVTYTKLKTVSDIQMFAFRRNPYTE